MSHSLLQTVCQGHTNMSVTCDHNHGGHPAGKPGKVREFGPVKVWEFDEDWNVATLHNPASLLNCTWLVKIQPELPGL